MPDEADNITLRPVAPEDDPFLIEVYASSREDEMAAWGWDAAQQEFFLKMQLRVRDQAYPANYRGLEDYIILFNGERAGRLMITREDGSIRYVDLAILPQYRSRGIGTYIFKETFAEADRKGVYVYLMVLKTNTAAARLYRRLGFSVTGDDAVYLQMERPPEGQ